MNILAIDTSSEILSVSLSVNNSVYTSIVNAGTSHSSLLFDAIDTTVKDAHAERGDIDLFACMRGPGSFTGLRIGFAAVKGLAY
ncbi:MAG: tRNA (adenosine(37)-N6)-threonylcarbamoyltransferase complex dimerization subunit type 1 TsaB, partial [Spirochaetaceae bacterium]|nr:tRNA (adenosine(37)-N6)-threonylcarbamoyltransferase complex dimerization subunit type 1 TsaB [Spirochaetaceae bacterium]